MARGVIVTAYRGRSCRPHDRAETPTRIPQLHYGIVEPRAAGNVRPEIDEKLVLGVPAASDDRRESDECGEQARHLFTIPQAIAPETPTSQAPLDGTPLVSASRSKDREGVLVRDDGATAYFVEAVDSEPGIGPTAISVTTLDGGTRHVADLNTCDVAISPSATERGGQSPTTGISGTGSSIVSRFVSLSTNRTPFMTRESS